MAAPSGGAFIAFIERTAYSLLHDHSRRDCLASIEPKGRRELGFVFPHGIAISPAGHLYVVDGEASRVTILDATNGARLLAFGERGRAEGKLNGPMDVALDRKDCIYILERNGGGPSRNSLPIPPELDPF